MKYLLKYLNRPFLLLSVLFLIFILLNIQSFIDNVLFYASGSIISITIKGQWWFAALNIAAFLSLLFFLGRRNVNWKTHGLFSAFVISLFVEMYGASLLIYFISNNALDVPKESVHEVLFSLDFLGLSLGFDFWMILGTIVIIVGISIIIIGWHRLWSSKKTLCTFGVYRYSRHPQYVGFLYTIWGWMIAWPTITTLIFTPILTIAYLYAAKKEEQLMLKENKEYKKYAAETPFLL